MIVMKKEVAKKLKVRERKKKPGLKRQGAYKYRKLSKSWRRPRGRHSKLRMHRKARGKKPSVGYMAPRDVRGLTKSGYKPVLVSNIADLGKVDPKTDAAVIRSAVGRKKRLEITKEAEKKGLTVLNAYRFKFRNAK